MQFMNSSLDELVKNLLDNNFKFLSHEFMGKLLRLAKQKGVDSYEYTDNLKGFLMMNYLIDSNFLVP